jgi:hypothetical protein
MAKNESSFKPGNSPPKHRGKRERTKLIDALIRQGETEEGFYDLLITRALSGDDTFAFGELTKRVSPIPKQVSPTIEFDFPEAAKPYEQAAAVMLGISKGVIPPDIGYSFISSIGSMVDIEKTTEIKGRLEAIEKSLGLMGE